MALSFIFDAGKGETPATVAKQRAIVEALMAQQGAPRNVGEGLNALGDGIVANVLGHRADAAELAGQSHASDALSGLFDAGRFPAAPSSSSTASAAGSTDYHGDQLAWTDAAPYQKALLNTISGPESGGRYDVIYGGEKFSDFSRHPNQSIRIQTGPNAGRTSSAAGKYQFLGSTWDQQAKELGLPDFSPVNQDKAAWNLAAETYKAKTGQDLATVLQSGDPQAIASVGQALNGIWTSLPGGIEQGTNTNRFVAAYQRALGAGASPAEATAVAQQEQAKPVQVASLDPSAGVSATPRPVPQEYASKGITQEQWDAMNAPDGAPTSQGYAPGQPGATTPAGQRVLSTMMNPEPLSGRGGVVQALSAALQPAQAPAATSPVTEALAGATAPQQAAVPSLGVQKVAQAMSPEDASLPVMAGGSADVVQPGQGGPSAQDLMRAASDPWLSDEQRAVVNLMLKQQIDRADPANQLDMEYKRAQIGALNQKADAGFTLGQGETRFDSTGKQLAKGADKEVAKPAEVQEYEYAKAQGFPGTFADWEASKKGGMSLSVDPATGAVTFQQGGNIKPMTEGQSKDTTFATRAEGALNTLDAPSDPANPQSPPLSDALTSAAEAAGSNVPIVGNYLRSPGYQKAEQAGKEFLQAILRKDTGAAITKEETAEYGSVYLPRPGDSPELLAQKKASRARALEALKAGMTPQAILAQEKALAAGGQAPAAPQPGARPRASNPQTGETVEWDGAQWVPVK